MQMANNTNDASQKYVFSHILIFCTFPSCIYLPFEIYGGRTEKKYKPASRVTFLKGIWPTICVYLQSNCIK